MVRRGVWKLAGTPIVHVLHIGKTGGTAVRHALQAHQASSSHGILLEDHDARLAHIPRGEKVVFFLRDPVDRFISGFYSRQREGQPRYVSPWTPAETELFALFDTPDALGRALASGDSHTRASALRAMDGLGLVESYWHWFSDEATFRSRLDDVLFVGRQERLAEDFEKLKRMIGLPGEARLPTDDVESHRNLPGLDRRLGEAAEAAVREWYRPDYAFVRLCEEMAGLEPIENPRSPSGPRTG